MLDFAVINSSRLTEYCVAISEEKNIFPSLSTQNSQTKYFGILSNIFDQTFIF